MNDPDTIRVLVTTDNHVGYNESDYVRGNDASETFSEIMDLAVEHNVDLILQGGDLFHYNKPSRQSLYNVIKAIRRTCLGDKPVQLEMLNHGVFDMDDNDFNHVNYEDPNLNVAIPMFAISGNHDDAGGQAMLSAMDVLGATGLVNHFGRVVDIRDINIEPVLLRKGNTKLALYGLASVREERLKRAFADKAVKFLKPPNAETEWYNLLAVHQNNHAHERNNFLDQKLIPEFIDTVVWGHEHECLIDPIQNEYGHNIVQPGSSVATSLCEGEAVKKHVCIISINGRKATFDKILLKTVRPFVMERVILAEQPELADVAPDDSKGKVTQFMVDTVDRMIQDSKQEWLDQQDNPDDPEIEVPLPLIRLHVDYTGGYEVENPTRFSNRYRGLVANDNDIVVYARQKNVVQRRQNKDSDESGPALEEMETLVEEDEPVMNETKIHELVGQFLGEKGLEVLNEGPLGDAVRDFVQDMANSSKGAKGSVKEFVDGAMLQQMENLLRANIKEDNDSEVLQAMAAGKSLQKDMKYTKKEATNSNSKRKTTASGSGSSARAAASTTKSRSGATKGTTATAKGKGTRSRATKQVSDSEEEDVDDDDNEPITISDSDVEMEDSPPPPPKRTTARTRGKAAAGARGAAAAAATTSRAGAAAPKTKAKATAPKTKTTTTASRKSKVVQKPPPPSVPVEDIDDSDSDSDSGFV